jgi:hypothetical protein
MDADCRDCGGAEFPLLVRYKAVVDGTSGDTLLDAVDYTEKFSRLLPSYPSRGFRRDAYFVRNWFGSGLGGRTVGADAGGTEGG